MDPRARHLRNLFIVLIVATGFLAILPCGGEAKLFLLLPLAALAMGVGIAWIIRTPDKSATAPDLLRQEVGQYFEVDGLCFAPRLNVEDGLCWFEFVCQNRFGNSCTGTIACVPVDGMSRQEPHEVPPAVVDVVLEGGELKLVSIPYPIAAGWQGRLMVYDVAARNEYPDSPGRQLVGGTGMPASPLRSGLGSAAATAASLAAGAIVFTRRASVELELPSGVLERLGDEAPQPRGRTLGQVAHPPG